MPRVQKTNTRGSVREPASDAQQPLQPDAQTAALRLLFARRLSGAFGVSRLSSEVLALRETEPTVVWQQAIRGCRRIVVLRARSTGPCMRGFAVVPSNPVRSVQRGLTRRVHVPRARSWKVASDQAAPRCVLLRSVPGSGYAMRVRSMRASGIVVRESLCCSLHPKPNQLLHRTRGAASPCFAGLVSARR